MRKAKRRRKMRQSEKLAELALALDTIDGLIDTVNTDKQARKVCRAINTVMYELARSLRGKGPSLRESLQTRGVTVVVFECGDMDESTLH